MRKKILKSVYHIIGILSIFNLFRLVLMMAVYNKIVSDLLKHATEINIDLSIFVDNGHIAMLQNMFDLLQGSFGVLSSISINYDVLLINMVIVLFYVFLCILLPLRKKTNQSVIVD